MWWLLTYQNGHNWILHSKRIYALFNDLWGDLTWERKQAIVETEIIILIIEVYPWLEAWLTELRQSVGSMVETQHDKVCGTRNLGYPGPSVQAVCAGNLVFHFSPTKWGKLKSILKVPILIKYNKTNEIHKIYPEHRKCFNVLLVNKS